MLLLVGKPSRFQCFLAGVDDDRVAEPLSEEEQENENILEDHDDLIHDYETTQLKKFFLEEMGRVKPQWVQTCNEETTRSEIMLAIGCANNDM